ncbi:MAG: hypothetical protein N2045_03575 [Fimbriimonadales bacterium]|nr:hypothetical protein [Fimbriimonadales bacterium]
MRRVGGFGGNGDIDFAVAQTKPVSHIDIVRLIEVAHQLHQPPLQVVHADCSLGGARLVRAQNQATLGLRGMHPDGGVVCM